MTGQKVAVTNLEELESLDLHVLTRSASEGEALYAFANVAASQTDAALVASAIGHRVRVLKWMAVCGATATALTFNTKGLGAGVAISCLYANGANGGEVVPRDGGPIDDDPGWFQTGMGEGLTVTTGAGSTTGIQIVYVLVAA